MVKVKDLLDKYKLAVYVLVILLAFSVFTLFHKEPRVSIKPVKENRLSETEKLIKELNLLKERLAKLEPVSPVKIVTADQPARSGEFLPVLTVMAEGIRVPFETIYQDRAWVRPDYQPYWHSTQGQWSSLPDRIHDSYHRLFITPGIATLWDETVHDSGIAEAAAKITLPVYDVKPENTIAIIAVQHQVTDLVVLQNQVVLLGTPARTGVQVLALNKQDLVKSVSGEILAQNNNQEYLFQMVTPDGYEVDYCNTIISY